MKKRTHTCGELQRTEAGSTVVLNGWIDRIRNLGGIIFFSLRDRYGITQITVHPDTRSYDLAASLRGEDVVCVQGKVIERPQEARNPEMLTGEIEVLAYEVELLSKAATPPIYTNKEEDVTEEMRLRYRYLDLRKPRMQKNLILRHQVTHAIRDFFNREGFLDIETPILNKSTPEGARDYLVPSRMKPGKVYALPQSPQILKQLLMIAGTDRYYQIAKCFRDEDLRADRQPEFTQIDYEMSFATEEDVMDVTEAMLAQVFREVKGIEIPRPFPIISFEQAMNDYGTDKPDLRYDMKLQEVSEYFQESSFAIAKDILHQGGVVKGFTLPENGNAYSRKTITELETFVRQYEAGGLMTLKYGNEGIQSSFQKYFSPELLRSLAERMNISQGAIAFLIMGEKETVNTALGALRTHIAKKEKKTSGQTDAFLWVNRFPMFHYDEESKRYVAEHHPFTLPVMEEFDRWNHQDPLRIHAHAYDVVMNGWELGGGSVRIHETETQKKVFTLLGLDESDQKDKFGFLLEAFLYGTPPHAGCALGLDRLVALMAGEDYIREVIAFPKTTTGTCLMTGAPSEVPEDQLRILGLEVLSNRRPSKEGVS